MASVSDMATYRVPEIHGEHCQAIRGRKPIASAGYEAA